MNSEGSWPVFSQTLHGIARKLSKWSVIGISCLFGDTDSEVSCFGAPLLLKEHVAVLLLYFKAQNTRYPEAKTPYLWHWSCLCVRLSRYPAHYTTAPVERVTHFERAPLSYEGVQQRLPMEDCSKPTQQDVYPTHMASTGILTRSVV